MVEGGGSRKELEEEQIRMMKAIVRAMTLVALVWCSLSSQAADHRAAAKSNAQSNVKRSSTRWSDDKSTVTLVYDHKLPNVPGKSMKALLVEYKPGGFTPAHTHPKSAFIYATVLEGEIQSQVNKGPIKTYKAGENFSEMPGDLHGVSANASKTKPARLLAVFVVDSNEKELTTICK